MRRRAGYASKDVAGSNMITTAQAGPRRVMARALLAITCLSAGSAVIAQSNGEPAGQTKPPPVNSLTDMIMQGELDLNFRYRYEYVDQDGFDRDAKASTLRSLLVSVVLVLVGLRMGLGALNMWRLGLLNREFPRYQYQHIRWQEEGKTNTALAVQIEAIIQGLANASFLALPVFIIASNSSPQFSILEVVGLVIWLLAFAMGSLADFQKVRFLSEMKQAGRKRQVCDVGLWRYCRHPNYFAEWMVWNGLIIAALPSWLALQDSENMTMWLLLGASLLYASRVMYSTLVYTTGAVPSEYYSVQKRPAYSEYQERTNRFFPGPPRLSKRDIQYASIEPLRKITSGGLFSLVGLFTS